MKLLYSLSFTLCLIVASLSSYSQTQFWLGTYTKGSSEGIYNCQLNDTNGDVTVLKTAAKVENPSFLTISSDRKYLIAAGEISDQNKQGKVHLYKITNNGSLQLVNSVSSQGAHPCFVSKYRNNVAVANYTGGNVALFQLSNKGLSPATDVKQHTGKGINPQRQKAPHTHSAYFVASKNLLFVADLGTDHVKVYSVKKGMLTLKSEIKMPAGAGPRHIAFHPNLPLIYVANELSSSVSVISHENFKTFEIKQTTTTLPFNFEGENTCADIHISADGKFLYISNRGADSITIFKTDHKGRLSLISNEPTRGKTPRNFAISPNQKYLLVANQNSNNITSFRRDLKTGKLTYLSTTKAPTPVCICF